MSTAQEIEDAIRSLPSSERSKLLQHIPQIFPELKENADAYGLSAEEIERIGKKLNARAKKRIANGQSRTFTGSIDDIL